MSITYPPAKAFYEAFMRNRSINREFYERVDEDNFDFRLVENTKKRSDSVRESLSHQIDTQRAYMDAISSGKLEFGRKDESLRSKTKSELLEIFSRLDQELQEILAIEESCKKIIIVPWNPNGTDAITMLWSMNSHEILHTGWNLALMDVLEIERFESLKKMWG